jgi:hypothetical protein
MLNATAHALRVFSIACAAIVLLLFPRFVASYGVVRAHPLELRQRPDVVAVSLGDGAWLPARGLAVARVIRGIPAGMRICYRFANGSVQCGTVRNVPEDTARTLSRTVNAIVALAFVLAGAVLALIGVDRRALAAAGMLAGLGLLFGIDFLEPALVAIRDLSVQAKVIAVWEWFPRYAGLLAMLLFAAEFPATLPRSRGTAALLFLLTLFVAAESVLEGLAHLPGLLDGSSLRAQAAVVSLILLDQQLIYAAAAIGVIAFSIRQRRHAASRPPQLRRSGHVVATSILFGFGPPMTLGVLQLVAGVVTGRRPLPHALVSASFLTVLAVPAAVMYAVMAKRVDSVRIVARRALLATFADRVFPFVKLAPLALLAIVLYANRQRPLEQIVAAHPLALGALAASAVSLFAFGDRARRALQAVFFRNAAATRATLAALPSLVAQAETIEVLANLLERELDTAFHPEAVSLFVRDTREQRFTAIGKDAPMLGASSSIAAALERARHPVAAAELDASELVETERHWLAVTGAELLVPLAVADQLVAVLVLGERRSELPFSESDAASLMRVATAAALVVENQSLRHRRGDAPARASVAHADDEPALVCRACNRYYSMSVTSRCAADGAELQLADIPYVLSGKYRMEQRLGAGGMGVVYRARDLTLERDVAVKTLPRLSVETAARLRREARTAANLLHPNLATIYAVETWRGTPMLILEYLDDGTLGERVGRGLLPIETIVRCGASIAGALAHVHARAILHRDVKPSNIGFSRGSGAKLLDFGLAHLLEDRTMQRELLSGASDAQVAPSRLTVTSGVVGTPAYLSPEAILGEAAHADFDLWSLSVTLYEAVTGSNPFVEKTIAGTMNAILARPVPDPRELRPDCPPRLSRFLTTSLDRERERRPHSAAELALRLREAVA